MRNKLKTNQSLVPGTRYMFLTMIFLLLSLAYSYAQQRTVKGSVYDENNEPIIGASVTVKGTSIGTITDLDGIFSIEAKASDILEVGYIGYVKQSVPVAGQSQIKIVLKEDTQLLDEVVVVGYGIMKKSDVTGAMVNVSSEEIRKLPVTNALQAMQGRAAGVDITSNERPGEIGKVLIRGSRSLNASNSPLYVVDGIPLSSGGIEALNPLDIESIDVLKDASATAVFGSKGANGVVLVTTKRGKSGKMSLDYSGIVTIENMYDRTEMMNSPQYVEFRRDAFRRASKNTYPEVPTLEADKAIFGQDPIAWANIEKGWAGGTFNGNLVPTTDWTDLVLRTGLTHEHTLSASGGTDKMRTHTSFGYLNQEGTQKGQDFERYNVKISTDINPTKWFSMGASITGTWSVQNYGYATSNATGPGNLYFAARAMLPYAVPFDENGNRINMPGGDVNILNPIGDDQYVINERTTLRTLGSFYAEIKFMEGLRYRVNFGPDFYNFRNGRFMDERSSNRGAGEPGSTNYAQLNKTQRLSWTLDNLIYYDKTFNKEHNLGVTLLQSSSKFHEETSSMTASNLPWSSQLWNQLNSVSALDAFGSGLVETQLLSYMARANYSFNSKYMLTASARWDGASQLAEGNKWDFFPSAAVGWRIDQEDFLKNQTWINQMKVRLGVGSTGNSAIDPYQTKGGVETLYYTWGALVAPGYVQSDPSMKEPIVMPDKNLGWERTTQWNLGLDFSFFNNRLSGNLDLYTSTTSDLLMQRDIPSVTGYTRVWTNIGKTSNKGIDLTLNTVNIETRDFTWSTNLNFSASKDKILELANGKEDILANNWFIGQRLGVFYDYQKDRIWQNTSEDLAEMAKFNANGHAFKPGDIKIVDQNEDYKIDANNDRKIVGQKNPSWTAGLVNTFTYKNWELSVFIFSRWNFLMETGAEALQGRFAQRVVDYWTPTNPTNAYPAPNYDRASGDDFKSSMNYQDGSFIKLRNISLGYVFPQKSLGNLGVTNLKLFTQFRNPGLLYSKIDWIDPDLGGSTFNRGFIVGINIGF
ncbi:SusC/RagA family TonB-linked outer membrane protein [Dysgonomonas sp. GY617]|uniref:SusC/RagA family TonB-linked outer membrane protein n=1 Tax=Dysgonomonas sp. GY617 TaxID=2780420 RepID=UPI0018834E4B|nr:TonB-dependent receptor [Dysgonomonas sp. GY617]MBF0574376.1 TonB-dependent receptor [Dysgonomonas sp. GY617]